MNIRRTLRGWRREDRGWPRYLPGGRVRTSTAGLLIAFIALFWLYQVYEPPARAPEVPATAVVPPGFVPDPDYTWVPRTQVQEPTPRTTTTTAPTTTTTSPTTTSPTAPTTPDETTSPTGPTTTVIDPDGTGPLSPQTFTEAPPPALTPGPTPAAPVAPTTLPPQ